MQPFDIPASYAGQTWAIVPVKPLAEAKSRLAPSLSAAERATLAFNLLKHTLQVLQELAETKKLAGTVVVSSDQYILSQATKLSALALFQERNGSDPTDNELLNRDLKVATGWAINRLEASRLLILPADLPWLTSLDVSELLAAKDEVMLAPDRARRGTNALLLPAQIAQTFIYSFGENSFNLHRQQLDQQGIIYKVVYQDRLAFDLDRVEDLGQLSLTVKNALLAK